jgi:hypothetical protein
VVTFVAGPLPGGRFGTSIVVVADQNGDAAADVVVGAPNIDRLGGGTLYLLDGRTGAVLDQVAGDPDMDGFGAAVAALDLLGDGSLDVVVGAPQAQNGRGRLEAYGLPGFSPKGDFTGDQGPGAFGHAMMPTVRGDNRRTLAVAVTAPGQVFSPRIYVMDGQQDAPGVFDLTRLTRLNVDPIWIDFGRALTVIPSVRAGQPDDFIVSALTPLTREGRILRFNRASDNDLLSDYRPDDITWGSGLALAVLTSPSRVVFAGDPDGGAGRVSAFPVDEDGIVHPIGTLEAPADTVQFGASLLAVPAWPAAGPADVGTPALCVGAPGDEDVGGRVVCLGFTAGFGGMGGPPEALFTIDGAAGTGFGAVLAAAPAPDADGSWLLVIGAPAFEAGPPEVAGGLHLVRFPAPP